MFAVVIVIMQFVTLCFIGGFARTSTIQSSFTYFGSNILFLLAWTVMNSPFKKLTLHSLAILFITSAITFEANLLFGRFWYNVFNGFNTEY